MKGLYWVYVYAIELWKMILIMRGILGIEPVRKRQVLMFQIPAVLGVLASFKYQLPVNGFILISFFCQCLPGSEFRSWIF